VSELITYLDELIAGLSAVEELLVNGYKLVRDMDGGLWTLFDDHGYEVYRRPTLRELLIEIGVDVMLESSSGEPSI
jgi:hypothetical protein